MKALPWVADHVGGGGLPTSYQHMGPGAATAQQQGKADVYLQ